MKRLTYILTILWLGILSSPLVYAADSCPKDSIIGRSQDGSCTYLDKYLYDVSGHTILEEKWRLNSDSVLVGLSKTTTEYYPNGKIKETASWIWSVEKNDWIGKEKNYYEYHENGKYTLWESYSWGGNDWATRTKYEYEYDSKGNITLEIDYTGYENGWLPQTKQEYSRDSNGKVIFNRYWSSFDQSTNQWIGKSWLILEYGSTSFPNYETLKESYIWKNNDWTGDVKYTREFDGAGNIVNEIDYSYNLESKTWVSLDRYIAKYDIWNNLIESEEYKRIDNNWVGIQKFKKEYTAYKSDPIMTATFAWDSIKSAFIGVDSIRLAKDATGNQLLDEQYTWSGNDWAGIKKEEYTYDANKLILSTITYSWNVTKAQWGNSTKVLADYDSHKNQTKDERYQWAADATLAEGGYWKGTKYETTTYNDKNVETDKITYQWDDTNRRWLGNSKSIYEFDAANHLILEEQYTWSLDPSIPEGGTWHGTKKEEFGYNAANLQTKAISYAWSDAINDWIGQTKQLSNFDSYKNQILNEQYTWVVEATSTGGYWKGTEKEEYTYNSNKQQTSSLIYAWDDSARDWTYVSKTKATFDSYKNMTLDERYEWQNGEWVGTLKNEYAYNAKGQQIMFAYYAWDADAKIFIGMVKEEDEQDGEGRTIMHAEYTWGTTDWKGTSKHTYTYLAGDLQATSISYKWQSNHWVENKKTEWTYTETNKVKAEIISTWGSGAWANDTKLENTYTDDVVTSYINYKWESGTWANVSMWEQLDKNTDRSYEWWNSVWSITQENKKTYDGENRLILESKQNWQQGVQTEGSKSVYEYTGSNLTLKTDSVYSNALSQWQETKRVVNTFDGENRQTLAMMLVYENGSRTSGDSTTTVYNGQNVEEVAYIWADNRWQGETKYEKVYASELNVTITESKWMDDDWFGVSKKSYEYYASGEEKSIIDYNFQITTSTWVYDTKVEYEYSGTKNIVTANYKWQNSAWVGLTKDGVFYDEGEDLTIATWTWTGGAWVGKTKLGESHDANGNLVGQTTYSWKNGEFVYNKKTEVEYTSTNTKDKITASYTWNAITNAWHGDSKSGVTFASNGKIATQTTYVWLSGFDWQYSQLTENSYGSGKDLTTAIYTWNTTTNAWQGVSKSGETYAANGKISSQFSYVWGDTCWLNVKKTEWEYGEGKNNAVATYKGKDTTWVGISKEATEYYENGDIKGYYTFAWSDSIWENKKLTEYTYNEYGDTTMLIYADWKKGAWKISIKSTKRDVVYYSYKDTLIKSDAKYTWSTTRQNWVGSKFYENEFDEHNRVIKYTEYTWSNMTWIGKSIIESRYDSMENLVMYAQWEWGGETWVGKKKSESLYNSSNVQTMSALYYWDYSRNDWYGVTKSEYFFDSQGRNTEYTSYTWDYTLWNWKIGNSNIYVYDDQNRYISETHIQEDVSIKTEYEYDKYGTTIRKEQYLYTDQWTLISQKIVSYDQDENYKLRYELSASWDNDIIKSYQQKSYYYACDPKFQIEVKASPEEGGSVSGGGVFILNGQARLTATPEEGCYTFKHWIDKDSAVVSTEPKYTFLVNKSNTYTAVFEPIMRTIRASVKDNIGGSVSVAIKPDE